MMGRMPDQLGYVSVRKRATSSARATSTKEDMLCRVRSSYL